ncbi:multidrug effflux MFS transporter [Myroides guanonis]|uniref:Drug resistance transporter, Bcr/CflA subfamily n=1 Tax=Myroides guanonis TaxID=1150112 RepID=A0A1I3S1C7_9FLAO|nr:multidrug effflux MFS transporter [Myroides guanonis]SFJ51932.1 drug resistance transporter, Bcr/CflA subfamily [Myroides guanonis]
MKTKPSLLLLIILIMFPQFVETIYSPALPSISEEFNVTNEEASQTISIYFLAFAIGVIFWGIAADKIGRRKAMIYGLITYSIGSILALIATNFNIIMIARVISAFGIAVGSVVTQTIFRDLYDKKELGKVFSIIGIALSISPVLGLLLGGIVVKNYGIIGVFSSLVFLSFVLGIASFKFLPETKKELDLKINFKELVRALLCDQLIWLSVVLVAAFNIMLFCYYSLAPFIFDKLGYSSTQFGYSGILLATSSLIGGIINKKMIHNNVSSTVLILVASIIATIGGLGTLLLQDSLYFLVPMIFVVIGFSIAIPNILSEALVKYRDVAGTAGALFGLMYYILIGIGLAISGLIQNLGLILTILSCFSFVLAIVYKRVTPSNEQ